MSSTSSKAASSEVTETRFLTRLLDEGYGPGAWHGAAESCTR